jgi:hypothetical protein
MVIAEVMVPDVQVRANMVDVVDADMEAMAEAKVVGMAMDMDATRFHLTVRCTNKKRTMTMLAMRKMHNFS